jgi:hypothetical protein
MSINPQQFKIALHQQCVDLVNQRLDTLNRAYIESREALSSEAKSTAGDKHETGRAMIQLEQEKMSRQLLETQKLAHLIVRINPVKECKTVMAGAVVLVNQDWYYMAAGLGKINLKEGSAFVMAPTSPLAQAMLGKAAGDTFTFNTNLYTVAEVY